MIYHYTTLEALNAMLRCYRKAEDKENLVFWASSIYTMNDWKEMYYGWAVVMKNLENYEKENNVAVNFRLSAFMEKLKTSDSSEIFMQHFYHNDKTPFVISFSEKKDDINMWYMYGGQGKGLCLCFDKEVLIAQNKNCLLLNVLYVNQKDNDEVSSEVLGRIITEEYEKFLNKDSKTDLDRLLTIGSLLLLVGVYVKDGAFVHEREKRLYKIVDNVHESIDFRLSSRGNIIPYVEVPLPIKSLKEITIGPCLRPEHIVKGLLVELSVCGLDIPVSISDVPYQEI